MLCVDSGRVTDPETLSPAEIVQAYTPGTNLVVQFSTPEARTSANLEALNEACRQVQGGLEVRFFGHYGAPFDASLLRYLPEVHDLAVDCLGSIENEDAIGQLAKLKRLSFGVFEFNRPDFLDTLDLDQLNALSLGESRKGNLDLAPLARCEKLEDLYVDGQSKGLNAVAALPRLRKLTLRAYTKAHPLSFVSSMPNLRELSLILGGRLGIDDLASATIEKLEIVRVRGLASLGDLARLPKLSALRVEDQLQLSELDLRGANLETLWLYNCKNLATITGLELQNRLRTFRASVVALDLDQLRDRDWPATTTSVDLFSGRNKWDEAARQSLAARGLAGKSGMWSEL